MTCSPALEGWSEPRATLPIIHLMRSGTFSNTTASGFRAFTTAQKLLHRLARPSAWGTLSLLHQALDLRPSGPREGLARWTACDEGDASDAPFGEKSEEVLRV